MNTDHISFLFLFTWCLDNILGDRIANEGAFLRRDRNERMGENQNVEHFLHPLGKPVEDPFADPPNAHKHSNVSRKTEGTGTGV